MVMKLVILMLDIIGSPDLCPLFHISRRICHVCNFTPYGIEDDTGINQVSCEPDLLPIESIWEMGKFASPCVRVLHCSCSAFLWDNSTEECSKHLRYNGVAIRNWWDNHLAVEIKE